MYVCMCVCIYIYIYIHIYTHERQLWTSHIHTVVTFRSVICEQQHHVFSKSAFQVNQMIGPRCPNCPLNGCLGEAHWGESGHNVRCNLCFGLVCMCMYYGMRVCMPCYACVEHACNIFLYDICMCHACIYVRLSACIICIICMHAVCMNRMYVYVYVYVYVYMASCAPDCCTLRGGSWRHQTFSLSIGK